MNYELYYMETPSQRRNRRHQEDKSSNPLRHFINKEKYSHEEARKLCPFCVEEIKDQYEYSPRTCEFFRKKD